jgi:hypothetical protein
MATAGISAASLKTDEHSSSTSRTAGGRLSHIELGAFLNSGNGPEQQPLLRLIATLVDVPPHADRK